MTYRALTSLVLLGSVSFLLAGDPPEPAPEKKEAPPAPALRAVVSHQEVLACFAEGVARNGHECPAVPAHVVGVIPAAEGPMQLPVGRRTIRSMADLHPEDPCQENKVVEEGSWETQDLGRGIRALSVTSETYRKAVGEKVGIADVKLLGLYRLDLEGNGTDEVVFVADSHGGERPFTEGPYESYSYIGVRMVAPDGSVVTQMLYENQTTVRFEDGFPDISLGELLGFTDLDGDGSLEVVVTARGYESYTNLVYRVSAEKVEQLGLSGCAI